MKCTSRIQDLFVFYGCICTVPWYATADEACTDGKVPVRYLMPMRTVQCLNVNGLHGSTLIKQAINCCWFTVKKLICLALCLMNQNDKDINRNTLSTNYILTVSLCSVELVCN